jgi:sulfur carrier protein ThiS
MGFDSMKIRVKLQRTNETKQVEIDSESKVLDLLSELDVKPDTVIVMNNGKPMPVDDTLVDGQEVVIVQVSSGG